MIQEIHKHLEEREDKEKTSFWPSETEKMVFDIYHDWIGTPQTNPPEGKTQMIFMAGKMMEEAIVTALVGAGVAQPLEEQLHIEIEREGVPISGYVDALDVVGNPCEIKSFYGMYQAKELQEGKPRTSYLKQLAIYMDALDKDKGTLLYIERGTGEMFEFELRRYNNIFKCENVEFDITDTYKKWARLYKNNVLPKVEPKPDYLYKLPVEEVKWKSLSKSDISKARNNKKVIGEHPWIVQYSSYKDLIVERQGTELGYSEEELGKIKELTAGFSSWK